MKEVETYTILSKGEDRVECMPELLVPITLSVKSTESIPQDVEILPDFIDILGPYVHIIGHIAISQALLYCDAKYYLNAGLAEGQEIGSLKIYFNEPTDK